LIGDVSERNHHVLCPLCFTAGGENISLTWDNRKDYVRLLLDWRKNEFSVQCEAMRRGLACVVPATLLSLFTWNELEVQVTGRPKMDIELLKRMTTYEGCSASDSHINFFWEMYVFVFY